MRVNCILPGYVSTPLLGAARIDRRGSALTARRIEAASADLADAQPLGRTGDLGDIAAMAAFLASEDSGWITGGAHVVDGGLTIGVPWRQQPPLLTEQRPAGPVR